MDRPCPPLLARQSRRQRASEASGHDVRVLTVRRDPPDLDRFVAALLALALAELDGVPGDDRAVEQSSER